MEIDIIDLTDSAYSNLSPVQLAMVRAAQSKKDKILQKAEKEKGEVFVLALANFVPRATAVRDERARIDAEAEREVELIRNDLTYQLAYEALGTEGNESGPYRYPENPNYNLTYSQRFLVVRSYYMEVTNDPEARLNAYRMDTLARTYLGEFYQTLYDLLASYC